MQVFIGWSGPRSKHVALSLQSWLRLVIQSLNPWLSPDIEKGARWGEELATNLETSKIGIICLTKDNIRAPWIFFEAGALSKSKADPVCTFLYDLKPNDIGYPLAQFQHTENNKEDIGKLITTINDAGPKYGDKRLQEEVLKNSFDTYWDKLADALKKTPGLDSRSEKPVRTQDDMLQEILSTLRALNILYYDLQTSVSRVLFNLARPPIASGAGTLSPDPFAGLLGTLLKWQAQGQPAGPPGAGQPDILAGPAGPRGPDYDIIKSGTAADVHPGAPDYTKKPPEEK